MSLSYTPTPAALAREAERLERMSQRARSCADTVPTGCNANAYADRLLRQARDCKQRAGMC